MTNGWAQHPHAVKRTPPVVMTMRSEASGTLTVSLSSAPDGVPLSGASTQRTLNFGQVSYASASTARNFTVVRHAGGFAVTTHFGLAIQDPSARVTRATVLAAIAVPEVHFGFRLDGFALGVTPQVVDGNAKVGTTSQHALEIDVPSSVTEKNSQLQNAILVQVIAN